MKKRQILRVYACKKNLLQREKRNSTESPPPSQGAQRPQRGRVGEGGADNYPASMGHVFNWSLSSNKRSLLYPCHHNRLPKPARDQNAAIGEQALWITPTPTLPRCGRGRVLQGRELNIGGRAIKKIALAALLITQLPTHALTLELALDGQIHGVPVENLQLRVESDDYQHWHVSGQLPATRLAGSSLKNTVLEAQLRRDGDHLAIETLALRSQRGKTPLRLNADRILLQNLLRGELQLPPRAKLRLQAGKHTLQTTLSAANGSAHLAADLPLALVQTLLNARGIQTGGSLRPDLTLRQTADGLRLTGSVALDDVHYNSADSLQAAEHLGGSATLDLHQHGDRWQGDLSLHLDRGEILISPAYLKLDGAPIDLTARLDGQPGRLALRDLTLDDGKTHARADLDWNTAQNRLTALTLHQLSGDADNLYRRYLKPMLGDGLFGDAELKGSLYLRGNYRDGKIGELAAVLHHITLTDRQGRYQLRDLDGQAGNNGAPSRLTLAGARWHKLPVGALRAELRWDASGVTLQKPLHIPLLDGGITIHRLAPQGDNYKISAQIEPISLAHLGEALDTVRFRGMISGTLPDIRLARDGLQLQQPVNVALFDGNIQIEQLHISRFFSDAPLAVFNLSLHHLDLQQLTNAFGIGEIEGRIEGSAEDVVLTNWRPQYFRARLQTPAQNPGRRRISHEAVAYLSRVGDGGSNLMVSQFIRVLNRFPYDKLGFSAELANGVLKLDGIAPAADGQNGYYLVKGRGVPHLDIIGHTREIDWAELLNRLKSASESEGAQVESKLGQ